jgi:hypothetical protein
MKIDGGCHCGKITFEAEIDPDKVAICHCTDCQTLSGTVFRTVVPVPEDKLSLTGKVQIYIKTGSSGAKRQQSFCPNCGSPIYATSVGDGPKIYNIRLGTARQRDQLVPKKQIWHRSAQTWLDGIDRMETVEEQ